MADREPTTTAGGDKGTSPRWRRVPIWVTVPAIIVLILAGVVIGTALFDADSGGRGGHGSGDGTEMTDDHGGDQPESEDGHGGEGADENDDHGGGDRGGSESERGGDHHG